MPKLLKSTSALESTEKGTESLGNMTLGLGHGLPGSSSICSHRRAVELGAAWILRNNKGFDG